MHGNLIDKSRGDHVWAPAGRAALTFGRVPLLSSFPRVRGPRAISLKQCPCRSGSGGRSHTSPQSRLWLEPAAESAATSWPPHRDGECGGAAALPSSTHATVRAAATPRYSGSNKRGEEVERVAAAVAAVSLPMHPASIGKSQIRRRFWQALPPH